MPKASRAARTAKAVCKRRLSQSSLPGGVIQNPPCNTTTSPLYSRELVNATGKFCAQGPRYFLCCGETVGAQKNRVTRIISAAALRGPDRGQRKSWTSGTFRRCRGSRDFEKCGHEPRAWAW